MKKTILYLSAILIIGSCKGFLPPDKGETENKEIASTKSQYIKEPTQIAFQDTLYKFGKVKEGVKVNFELPFTNTGDKDLVLFSVTPSCGCTVADFPKNPIKPSEKGIIHVTFSTEGKEGFVRKSVFVESNTLPTQNIIHFEGEILKD